MSKQKDLFALQIYASLDGHNSCITLDEETIYPEIISVRVDVENQYHRHVELVFPDLTQNEIFFVNQDTCFGKIDVNRWSKRLNELGFKVSYRKITFDDLCSPQEFKVSPKDCVQVSLDAHHLETCITVGELKVGLLQRLVVRFDGSRRYLELTFPEKSQYYAGYDFNTKDHYTRCQNLIESSFITIKRRDLETKPQETKSLRYASEKELEKLLGPLAAWF